jgi:hypothetical protein
MAFLPLFVCLLWWQNWTVFGNKLFYDKFPNRHSISSIHSNPQYFLGIIENFFPNQLTIFLSDVHVPHSLNTNIFFYFIRISTENDNYWQNNKFFIFCKMYENVTFFAHCIQNMQKVLLWPKKCFCELSKGYRKRQNLCWFQIRWNRLKNVLEKSCMYIFVALFSFDFCL